MNDDEAAAAALLGIDAGSPEVTVLRLLIRLAAQGVGAREGSYFAFDADAGDLVVAMTTADAEIARSLVGRRVPLGDGVTGLAAATREVQIGAPRYHFETDEGLRPPPEGQSLIAAPVLWKDELLGVLTAVSFDAERRFTREHGDLYASAATVAALVLRQRQRIRDLEQALRRDLTKRGLDATSGDAARVARSVGRLSRQVRLPELASLLETLESIAEGPVGE